MKKLFSTLFVTLAFVLSSLSVNAETKAISSMQEMPNALEAIENDEPIIIIIIIIIVEN
ncbi:hypothetical protein [Flavobacterium sp. NKUCC04_CG]|uniref:hypothetical protein n=1 Tax=Flavobacterium sp. NKUCC04_CG TaxID=2842121 RepID=UPI001C5AFC84|nr:hypothetical protein [Flavobacterium sp. NKUCC04_CG]MBW3518305.1 hypothetical protein [Flavobacterium sp. NKUCC04_CG]